MDESQRDRRNSGWPDWAVALLLAEAAALFIALATTLVPGRLGSTWSPADLLEAHPSTLERVAASLLLLNLILGIAGAAAWIGMRRKGPR